MIEEPYVLAKNPSGKYDAIPMSQAEAMKQMIYADEIHHPDHYTWKGTECKDVIEIMVTGLKGVEAYYMGNIIKYLYRYPRKGTIETDLAKAEEYIHFLRECYKNRKEDKNE